MTTARTVDPASARREFLEQQPTYWLKRSYQAMRRCVDGELRRHGLTLSQRDALLALAHPGDDGLRQASEETAAPSQTELTQRLGLEQSSVSRLIDGLRRRKLVAIREDADDRRSRLISLTEAGRQALAATPGSSRIAGSRMSAAFSPAEMDQFMDLMKRATAALEDGPHNGTQPDGAQTASLSN